MDILSKFQDEINKIYDESVTVDIVFNSPSVIRFGKKDHIWVYAKEWDWNGKTYQEIDFGSWKYGNKGNVKSWDKELSKDKNFAKAYKKKNTEAKAQQELDKKRKHKECAEKWSEIIKTMKPCTEHEYLTYKKVKPFGNILQDGNGVLVIPIYNINGFVGVQRIITDKKTGTFEKRFSSGIQISGSIFPLKKITKKDEMIYLSEGYATSASIQEAFPDVPSICCFNASNIPKAIETIRMKHPDIKICIASDDDHTVKTPIDNPGVYYSKISCKRYGQVIYKKPQFDMVEKDWTDFNDLAMVKGIDEVRKQLEMEGSEFSTIIPLGHNAGNYYYVSSENQQMVAIPTSMHTKIGLKRLVANRFFWLREYGVTDEETDTMKMDWDQAASDLIERCHKKGIFDPKKVRGIGVWKDGANYVINDGSKVINENKNTTFQYQKTIQTDYSFDYFEDPKEVLHLLDAFKRLRFKNENDFFYLASFVMQSFIFPILDWRFHIWVTGTAGTGKSTVLKWLNSLSMKGLLTDNATEAGIRQTIQSNAMTVVFDESEATNHRTEQVIELARQMSSNGEFETVRGSVSGNSINYNTQCVLCFGSIQIPILDQADRTRIFTVELDSVQAQSDKDYAEIDERFRYFINNKNKLFTHAYESIDSVLYNIAFCKSKLKSTHKMESRLADQMSVAMGCFWLYFSQDKMTDVNFDFLVDKFALTKSEYTESNSVKQHEDCYDSLMETVISLKDNLTIAEAIHNIKYESAQYSAKESVRLLGVYGMAYDKDENQLFIQNRNGNLKKKMASYPDFVRVLKRDDDIIVSESSRKKITQLGFVRGITIRIK